MPLVGNSPGHPKLWHAPDDARRAVIFAPPRVRPGEGRLDSPARGARSAANFALQGSTQIASLGSALQLAAVQREVSTVPRPPLQGAALAASSPTVPVVSSRRRSSAIEADSSTAALGRAVPSRRARSAGSPVPRPPLRAAALAGAVDHDTDSSTAASGRAAPEQAREERQEHGADASAASAALDGHRGGLVPANRPTRSASAKAAAASRGSCVLSPSALVVTSRRR